MNVAELLQASSACLTVCYSRNITRKSLRRSSARVSDNTKLGKPSRRGSKLTTMATMEVAFADTRDADENSTPALAVFDLDACLWDQEMFQLREVVDRSEPILGTLSADGAVGVVGALRQSCHSPSSWRPSLQHLRGALSWHAIGSRPSADTR